MSVSHGEECFLVFCAKMAAANMHGHCSNRQLARLASYFWNRFTAFYKKQWKLIAANYNSENGLTGKEKRRGFWHFAIMLQEQMLNYESALFSGIWQNFLPEERMKWMCPSDSLVAHELECVRVAIDNLTL